MPSPLFPGLIWLFRRQPVSEPRFSHEPRPNIRLYCAFHGSIWFQSVRHPDKRMKKSRNQEKLYGVFSENPATCRIILIATNQLASSGLGVCGSELLRTHTRHLNISLASYLLCICHKIALYIFQAVIYQTNVRFVIAESPI